MMKSIFSRNFIEEKDILISRYIIGEIEEKDYDPIMDEIHSSENLKINLDLLDSKIKEYLIFKKMNQISRKFDKIEKKLFQELKKDFYFIFDIFKDNIYILSDYSDQISNNDPEDPENDIQSFDEYKDRLFESLIRMEFELSDIF